MTSAVQIYLDYKASTPIDPAVVAAMRPLLENNFGNPSSGHWASHSAKAALDHARGEVAALLGAEADEIVFTSGGSEANNLALKGSFFALRDKGDHIITQVTEHPATLNPLRFLEQLGAKITYLPVDGCGRIDPQQVRHAITPRTIQPIEGIGAIAREYGVRLHTDAAQSLGKISARVNDLGSDQCCASKSGKTALSDPRWRRVLWIALIVNAIMFAVEIVAALSAGSRALQADAVDFLGDAANYAISLGVAGLALRWRGRAALAKGATMFAFGLWVFASALWGFLTTASPHAETMGIVGVVALAVNVGVALALYRYRTGDANMRSVWICSRNDVIGNIAVLAAALGVFGTGLAWPDLLVAGIMAALAIWGGWQVIAQARSELRTATA